MTSDDPDGALLSLAAAAERGDDCPYIYTLSGGWLIAGLPTSSKEFRAVTEHDLSRQLAHARPVTSAARRSSCRPWSRNACSR